MSNMKNFDKHIKDAFSNYSPPVAPGAWDKIMAERKRRKPKAFLWRLINARNVFVVAAALLGGTALWLMDNNYSNKKIIAEKENTSTGKLAANKNIIFFQ